MPVIPGAQEGQILNAGSPVPIASPEEARASGTAMAGLGNAMFSLGDALDKVAAQQKQKRDGLTELLALQEARKVALEEQANREQAAPIPEDATGYGQVKAFHENVNPKINEILAQVPDPETRRGAQARIMDMLNDTGKEVYGKEVLKRVKNNDALEGKVISESAGLARANPKEIETAMGIAELAITRNSDIPGDIRAVRIAEAKKQILADAIEGEVSKGGDANFANAEIILEKYSPGVLSPKEKAQRLDDIRNSQYKQANLDYTKLNRDEKRQEKYKAEAEKNAVAYYSAALQQAGNSDAKRDPIIKEMTLDMLSGKISETRVNALIGSKIFKQEQDDYYDATTMKRVFQTDEYSKAIDKVYADMGTTVSKERGSDIINRLKSLEERKHNDPKFNQLLKDGERLIRDQGADSITAVMDSATKRELLTKINIAVQDYHKKVLDSPKIDPINLSREIIANRFDARVVFMKGKENFMGLNTVEGVEKEKERIIRDAMALEKKGLMDKNQQKKVKENLNSLERIKKSIEVKNPTAGEAKPSTTGAPVSGAAARGKR